MTLRFKNLKGEDKVIRSLTGLDKEAFLKLSESLQIVWDEYIFRYTLEGKMRQRASRGRKNNVLPSTEDKLLFILYFLKTNPLQEALALQFDMNQPQAQRWITLLNMLLLKALEREQVLPVRDSKSLIALMTRMQKQEQEQQIDIEQEKGKDNSKKQLLMLDSTERRVRRKGDFELQKQYYSGKKKHTA